MRKLARVGLFILLFSAWTAGLPEAAWTQQALEPDYFFVTDSINNRVLAVPKVSGNSISISAGSAPRNIVASLDGKYVFVLNGSGNCVTPIDVTTLQALTPIPLGGYAPFDLTVSPDGTFLYIAATYRFFVLDIHAWSTDPAHPSPISFSMPAISGEFNMTNTALGFSPDRSTLYVSAINYRTVAPTGEAYRIYALKGTEALPTPKNAAQPAIASYLRQPTYVSFKNDGTRAFIGDANGAMVVDPLLDTVKGGSAITLPASVGELRTLRSGSGVFGPDTTNARVFVFSDTNDLLSLQRSIPFYEGSESLTTYGSYGVTSSPDGRYVYVTLNGAQSGTSSRVRSYDLLLGTRDKNLLITAADAQPNKIAVPYDMSPPPVDNEAPVFSNPMAAVAGSGDYHSVTVQLPSTAVDTRISVIDPGSGLNPASLHVEVSVDGGVNYAWAPAVTDATSGSKLEALIDVANLGLAHSLSPALPMNYVRYAIADMSEKEAVSVVPILVNLNPVRKLLAVSPDSGTSMNAPPAVLRWDRDPAIPMEALYSFEVQVATSADFTTVKESTVVAAPYVSYQSTQLWGTYYWRVRALDKFGLNSLFSDARSFTILDVTKPQFSGPQAAVAGSEVYQGVSVPVLSAAVDARVSVADSQSGLKRSSLKVELSVDDGASFVTVPATVSGLEGSTKTAQVDARALSLAQSISLAQPVNYLRCTLSDLADNVQVFTTPILADINAITPVVPQNPLAGMAFVGPVNFTWSLNAAVPAGAIASYEVRVATSADFTTLTASGATTNQSLLFVFPLQGTYFWQVRALDQFGRFSPYSGAISFTSEPLAPQFSDSGVAVARSGNYQDPSVMISSTIVDLRVSASSPYTGLALSTRKVEVSIDGGSHYRTVPATITGTEGTRLPQSIDAREVPLTHSINPSQTLNRVRYSVSDTTGRTGIREESLTVNINPVTPPTVLFPTAGEPVSLVSVPFRWQLDPAIPLAAIDHLELRIANAPEPGAFNPPLIQETFTPDAVNPQVTLPQDMPYYWQVRAKDQFGTFSPWSAVSSFTYVKLYAAVNAAGPLDSMAIFSRIPDLQVGVLPSAEEAPGFILAGLQGLDPISRIYSITPSATFNPPAMVSFLFDPAKVTDQGRLALYQYVPGVGWRTGLEAGILSQTIMSDANGIQVVAYLAHASEYALLEEIPDTLAPVSTLSVGAPRAGTSPIYVTSATPFSITATDDRKTPGDGIGTGVLETRYAVDSGSTLTYTSSFIIGAGGTHEIRFFSVDKAGNSELAKSSTVIVDVEAPETSFSISGASIVLDGMLYATAAASVVLNAHDALSGVDRLEYRLNGGVLQVASGAASFPLPEGSNVIAFQAADKVGNLETPRSVTIRVDATAPVSTVSVAGPLFVSSAGIRFITPASFVAFAAADPLSGGIASGLDRIEVNVDGAGFTTYISSLAFAEGRHSVQFRAVDRAGNVEAERALAFYSDASAPQSSLAMVGGHQAVRPEATYASSDTRFQLDAIDPLANDVASGVSFIRFQDNGGASQLYDAPLLLGAGAHTLTYFGVDNVGNVGVASSTLMTIDASSPQVGISSPAGGERLMPGQAGILIAFAVEDDHDPAPTTQASLVQVQDKGAPRGALPATVPVVPGQVLGAQDLDDGLWVLSVSAEDFVQNSTVARGGVFEVVHDTLPPRTTLAVGTPSLAGEPVYAATSTLLSFSAVDDMLTVGDSLGAGVATSYYLIDRTPGDCGIADLKSATIISTMPRGTCQNPVYSQNLPFTLVEGTHTVYYLSADKVGNLEALHAASIFVDGTPPVIAFSVVGSSRADVLGRVQLSTGSVLLFTAADPVAHGVSAGVLKLRYRLDTGAEQEVGGGSATIPIVEGLHTLFVGAYDRVTNEAFFSTSVIMDATPPSYGALEAAASGGQFAAASTPVQSSTVDARISVQDPLSGMNVTGGGALSSPLTAIPGTLGLWHFDEASGNIAYDSSGRGLNGTLNADVERVAGKIGGGVEVHGRTYSDPNEGVTLAPAAYSVINNLQKGSVELWAYLKQPGTYPGVGSFVFMVKQSNRQNTEFLFGTRTGGNLALFWHSNNSQPDCSSSFVPQLGRWYHFAATWNSSQSSIYVDGKEVQRCAGMSLGGNTGPTCLSIAGGCGDSNSDGNFIADEVRILDDALSPEQIAKDAGSGAVFSARYTNDGGANFSAVDTSSMSLNGSDGTVEPQLLCARGLRLRQSMGPSDASNQVEFSARDLAGNEGKALRSVLVNLNPLYTQVLAAPAEGALLTISTPAFSWTLDGHVPAGAISEFELQLAHDAAFTAPAVHTSPAPSFQASALMDGTYFWRVRAKDNFGAYSPFSSTRSFTIDTTPPAFRAPEVAAAGSGAYISAARPLNTLLADVRAEVQDAGSGLSVGLQGTGSALLEPIPGTLGLWHFDEPAGSVAYDAGPYGLNGTLNADVERVAGRLGGGIEVHGRTYSDPNEGVTLAPAAYSVINNLSHGSVELWAYLKQPGTYPGVGSFVFMVKQSNRQNTEFLFGTTPSGNLSLFWQTGNQDLPCNSSFRPELRRWYHLAATWDGTTSRIYVDGQQVQSCSYAVRLGDNTGPTCLSIAGGCGDSNSDGNYIADEVRVLNVALTPEQIVKDATFGRASALVKVSNDGGATFTAVDASSVTLGAENGSISPAKLTVSGLLLAGKAEGVNVVEMSASDLAGNATSYRFTVVADTIAPAAITDLAASAVSTSAITLSWSAPGDDGWTGSISDAEFRLSFSTAGQTFSTVAVQAVLDRTDIAPGTPLSWTLEHPLVGTTYYAAVFTRDTAGNWSQASDIAAARAMAVATSEDGVVQLVSSVPEATVSVVPATSSPSAYSIALASQALNPVGGVFYDLTSGLVFETPASLSFRFDPAHADPAALAIYTYDGIKWSSASIVDQQVTLLADGSGLLTGDISHTSLYASMVADTLAPVTAFEVAGASEVVGGVLRTLESSSFTLNTQDRSNLGGVASGVAATFWRLDGQVETPYEQAFMLAAGTHTLAYRSMDRSGNMESAKSILLDIQSVDTMPPTVTLSPADRSTVTTSAPMLAAVYSDAGRGVDAASVRLALDGADMTAQAVVTASSASFTPASPLAQGVHTLEAQVSDLAGNQAPASASFFIDSLPPVTTLLLNGQPAPAGTLIIASTDSLGFAATDSGVGAAQTLYALNGGSPIIFTTPFALAAGAYTLAFHSVDKAGNTETSRSVTVQVNSSEPPTDVPPVRLQVLGNSRMLHHPWDADDRGGKVYVADTNADRVLVLNQEGGFLTAYGNVQREEPYFEKPKALAVDGSGNIFVADTQHHRVVKLTSDGRFSFDIGDVQTKKGNKSFHPGSGSGQFRHPSGIALAPDGKIVVSDTGNRRIQVFNPDGSFVRAIALPSTNEDFDWDDEDCDRDEPAPFGVDVDASGNIYVADAKGHRALVFNADGTLRLSAGQSGNAAGSFRRPEGIAAAADGGFYVSDRKLDRLTKFDAQGRLRYVIGQHGEIKDGKPLPQDIVFNKPIGLSFDGQGRLYVADRNNERVQVFGPAPTSTGTTVASNASNPNDGGTDGTGAADEEFSRKHARGTIEKARGGKVLRADKAAVEVPPAALDDDLELTVSVPDEPQEQPERKEAREQKKLAAASEPVEYGPEGTTFAAPVTITLPYDRSALLARGSSEDALKVHYWNPDRKEWEELSSIVDKEAQTVSAKTMHFSLYQALAPEGDGTRAALTDSEAQFYLRDLYVFPNPARAGAKPTVHLAVGIADSVSIRFYDVSGRQVHETNIDRAPVVMDDGSGPKYVYEYSWDGHIPSGVYFFAVEAKRGGHGSIRRTGKLAVVR